MKEKVAVFSNSYLSGDDKDNLLVENETTEAAATTEGTEPEELLIVSTDVKQPAELDVVVIPDLETVGSEDKQENTPSEQAQEQPVEPQVTPPAADTAPSTEVVSESVPQEYYIKKGDNLLKILRAHYGNENKLQEVIDLNKIIDPNNIQVGQTILLP